MFKRQDPSVKHRIPPGQLETTRFPVLHYGPVAKFDPKTWSFRVWGEVEKPLQLNWEEFSALPRTKLMMDLHCVTTWSKLDTEWEGVSLKTLFDSGLVKLNPQVKMVSIDLLYCNYSCLLIAAKPIEQPTVLVVDIPGQFYRIEAWELTMVKPIRL